MEKKEKWDVLRDWIEKSSRIAFLGGAGVSTESGIPDFRSVDGLYHQKFDDPPEEILSHDYFFTYPEKFYKFYREKMLLFGAKPNGAHLALAKLEQMGKLTAVVTQNIDGLHQMAGSKKVLELHGSVMRNHCLSCHRFYSGQELLDMDLVPHCSCGGLIKPDVVLYGEALPEDTFSSAIEAIAKADMLIVGGTSLTVYPAAGLTRYYRGKRLVLINKSATSLDSRANLIITDPIGQVLSYCVGEA